MVPVVRHLCMAFVVVAVGTMLLPRDGDGPGVRSRVATAPVVVAAKDIPEGRVIDRAAVAVAMWPVPVIPAGAYSSVDSVLSRVARINVYKGEPIVPGRLTPEGTASGPAVTPGKRAYSIRINDVSGIAGMILPNSRVDILVTTNQRAGDMRSRMSKVFMSNMRVLAIGAQVQRGADGRPINSHVATLEFTPEEVEKIAIAANQGSLSLLLRGHGDPDSTTTHGTTAADITAMLRDAPDYRGPWPFRRPPPLVAPAPMVALPPPKPDTARVQTFRGAKSELERFDSTRHRP